MVMRSGSIPNLIGGVSQQPKELRIANTADELINSVDSVVSGRRKRDPFDFLSRFGADNTGSVAMHMIDGVVGKKILICTNDDVMVMDAETGALEPVSVPNPSDLDYLQSSLPALDIGFVTVADTTFIFNKNQKISVSYPGEAGDRVDPAFYSTFWVRQTAVQTNYNVYIDGSLKATYNYTDPNNISDTTAIAADLYADIGANGYTRWQNGSVVTVQLNAATERLVHTDGYGDEGMRSYNDGLNVFTDLPPSEINGRLVAIYGDPDETGDTYYVSYYDGVWSEDVAWDQKEELVASTMPHVLQSNGDGTWTFQEWTWPGRVVGDQVSNKSPSFVGRTINDMFVYKNRLCILAGENMIASQADNYENFYRTTCTQLLDEDRIDTPAGFESDAVLYHGVEYDKKLLLFSDNAQFIPTTPNGILSPVTCDLDKTTDYPVARWCQPAFIHNNIAFVDDATSSNYVQVREYYTEDDVGVQAGENITAQIPQYIPSGAYKIVSSNSRDVMVMATTGAKQSLFVYNYFYGNEGKVQSAWSRWDFPEFEVRSVGFIDDVLYVCVAHDGHLDMLKMTFDSELGATFTLHDVLIDYKINHASNGVAVAYDGTDTTITIPYAPTANSLLSRYCLVVIPGGDGRYKPGTVIFPDTIVGTTCTFERHNLTGTAFVMGYNYGFYWRLNPFYVKDEKQVVIQDGRLQLRYVTLLYNNTAYFDVFVTPEGRATVRETFTGKVLGDATNVLSTLPLATGGHRVAAPGKGDKVTIEVVNNEPFPSRFSSVEWTGNWRPKTKRVR